MIQVWREDRKSKKPDAVYHPVYIRDIHERGKRTWFIVERRPDEEDAKVTWLQFQKHLQKIGMKRKVGQDSIRLVSAKHTDELLRLWKAE